MKKLIVFVSMLCLVGSSTAFAYGGRHDYGYHDRSRHYGGHSSRHHGHSRGRHNDGIGIALGVVGGLLLGSALVNAAPPPAVVYEPPRRYQPPRICVQDQVISGEWQYSRYDGRQVWVEYAYPVTRRVQVPCY